MADQFYKWTGATSGDFTVTSNWIDAETGANPTVAPGNGDSLFFLTSPTNACDTNTDQNTLNFAKIVVGKDHDAPLATSASPLICACDQLWCEGPNETYFQASDGAGTDYLDKVFVYNGTVYLSAVDADVAADGPTGSVTQNTNLLQIFRGRVFLQNEGEFTTIDVVGQGGIDDAVLDIDSSLDDNGEIVTMNVRSGKVFCSADITTLNIEGGDVTLRDTCNVSTEANVRGGTLRLNSDFTSESGSNTALPLINQWRGIVTAADNEQAAAPTITLAEVYGGTYDMRTKKGTVTTTTVNVNGPGVNYFVDANKKLTIADQ